MHIPIRNLSFQRFPMNGFPKIYKEGERKVHWYWLSNLDFLFLAISSIRRMRIKFPSLSLSREMPILKSLKNCNLERIHFALYISSGFYRMPHLKMHNSKDFPYHFRKIPHNQSQKKKELCLSSSQVLYLNNIYENSY